VLCVCGETSSISRPDLLKTILLVPILRIRDVYPGSEFFQPGSVDTIRLKFLSRRRIVLSKKYAYLRALLSQYQRVLSVKKIHLDMKMFDRIWIYLDRYDILLSCVGGV
jgi:hypothetical protein